MSTKVYVGNLAWATTDEGLRDFFLQFGQVLDSIVMRDRETGRSRGFGFVTYSTADEAQEAIKNANERELDQRRIKVNIANAKNAAGGGGGYSGGYQNTGGYQSSQGAPNPSAYGQGGYGGTQGGYGGAQGGYGGGSGGYGGGGAAYGTSGGGSYGQSGYGSGQGYAGGQSAPYGGAGGDYGHSYSGYPPYGQQGGGNM